MIDMDHIPLPHNADPKAVPRVFLTSRTLGGSRLYDGGNFLDYPLRLIPQRKELLPQCMRDNSRWSSIVRSIPHAELEDIMQAWLLFGLTFEILGENLSREAIRIIIDQENPIKPYLSTSGLCDAVGLWVANCRASLLDEHDDDEIQKRYNGYTSCIWHTFSCLRAVFETVEQNSAKASDNSTTQFSRPLIWSIASVAELLAFAVYKAFDGRQVERYVFAFANFIRTTATEGMLRTNGWCPSEIALMEENVHLITAQYYLSRMKHSPFATDLHERCDDTHCSTLQSKLDHYEIGHRTNGCTCSMVTVKGESIHAAFRSEPGSYPLVRIKKGKLLELDIVTRSNDTPYIAISHLWADGMGNPVDNAMPTCQLEYLSLITTELKHRMVEKNLLDANQDVYLFIDTLVFPAKSDDDLKTLAIAEMGNIYQDASAVLIIDKALTEYRYEDLGANETFTRLCYSRWATRLWTLQEGSFAKKLYLQFQDQAVDLEIPRQNIVTSFEVIDEYTLISADALTKYYSLTRAGDLKQIGDVHPLAVLSLSVWSRKCSEPTDEVLCLSTILKYNMSLVTSSKPPDSMQRFWECVNTSQHGIPPQIITYDAPKIMAAGFRWAPSSFLRAAGCSRQFENRYKDPTYTRARITEDGLHVKLPGFRITSPRSRYVIPTGYMQAKELVYLWDLDGTGHTIYLRRKIATKTDEMAATDGMEHLIQRPGAHAIVLATGSSFAVVESTEKRYHHGVYGLCHRHSPSGHILVSSEGIIGLQQMNPSGQRFCSAALDLAKTIISRLRQADPDGTFESLGMSARSAQFFVTAMQEIKALAIEKVVENPDLALIASIAYPEDPQGAFLREVMLGVIGAYAIVEEQYSSQQDWIVD